METRQEISTLQIPNIMTEDVVRFFNQRTGMDLTSVFDQYLRRSTIPTLELTFNERDKSVAYRWIADVNGFAMPVRVGKKNQWQIIHPSTEWKRMPVGPVRNSTWRRTCIAST